jgi:conjugal transfer pilus assembly protein TraB
MIITLSTHKKKSEIQTSTKFDYPIDPQKFEAQWQEKMTELLKEQQAKGNKLEQALNQFNEHRGKQVELILQQEQQLKEVTSRLQQLEERPVSTLVDNPEHSEVGEAFEDTLLKKFHIQHLSLTAKEQSPLPKTDKTYVPSGSFVEAILLGGLDAHTGVSAQSDPHPVLLRVLDNGVLPKNHNSQLNHCHIIAAGFGDISSERAYIRLERMSCEQNGIFTDYPVYGYVTGPDGKDGIRGKVVLRDKAVVSRAFLGGFLSGLSEVTSQSLTTHSVSALGSVETVKGGDAALYSSSQGAGNAMCNVPR